MSDVFPNSQVPQQDKRTTEERYYINCPSLQSGIPLFLICKPGGPISVNKHCGFDELNKNCPSKRKPIRYARQMSEIIEFPMFATKSLAKKLLDIPNHLSNKISNHFDNNNLHNNNNSPYIQSSHSSTVNNNNESIASNDLDDEILERFEMLKNAPQRMYPLINSYFQCCCIVGQVYFIRLHVSVDYSFEYIIIPSPWKSINNETIYIIGEMIKKDGRIIQNNQSHQGHQQHQGQHGQYQHNQFRQPHHHQEAPYKFKGHMNSNELCNYLSKKVTKYNEYYLDEFKNEWKNELINNLPTGFDKQIKEFNNEIPFDLDSLVSVIDGGNNNRDNRDDRNNKKQRGNIKHRNKRSGNRNNDHKTKFLNEIMDEMRISRNELKDKILSSTQSSIDIARKNVGDMVLCQIYFHKCYYHSEFVLYVELTNDNINYHKFGIVFVNNKNNNSYVFEQLLTPYMMFYNIGLNYPNEMGIITNPQKNWWPAHVFDPNYSFFKLINNRPLPIPCKPSIPTPPQALPALPIVQVPQLLPHAPQISNKNVNVINNDGMAMLLKFANNNKPKTTATKTLVNNNNSNNKNNKNNPMDQILRRNGHKGTFHHINDGIRINNRNTSTINIGNAVKNLVDTKCIDEVPKQKQSNTSKITSILAGISNNNKTTRSLANGINSNDFIKNMMNKSQFENKDDKDDNNDKVQVIKTDRSRRKSRDRGRYSSKTTIISKTSKVLKQNIIVNTSNTTVQDNSSTKVIKPKPNTKVVPQTKVLVQDEKIDDISVTTVNKDSINTINNNSGSKGNDEWFESWWNLMEKVHKEPDEYKKISQTAWVIYQFCFFKNHLCAKIDNNGIVTCEFINNTDTFLNKKHRINRFWQLFNHFISLGKFNINLLNGIEKSKKNSTMPLDSIDGIKIWREKDLAHHLLESVKEHLDKVSIHDDAIKKRNSINNLNNINNINNINNMYNNRNFIQPAHLTNNSFVALAQLRNNRF